MSLEHRNDEPIDADSGELLVKCSPAAKSWLGKPPRTRPYKEDNWDIRRLRQMAQTAYAPPIKHTASDANRGLSTNLQYGDRSSAKAAADNAHR